MRDISTYKAFAHPWAVTDVLLAMEPADRDVMISDAVRLDETLSERIGRLAVQAGRWELVTLERTP